MFIIKTTVKPSTIHGLGVFAEENLKAGSIIWKFQENFDIVLNDQQYNDLPDLAKEYFKTYSYYSKNEGGYVLCGDNARYTNHSLNPNTISINNIETISNIDINIGDEITENYHTFDEMKSNI